MKPPTPAMIEALRKLDANSYGMLICHNGVKQALLNRGLIDSQIGSNDVWHITDAGWRVLAEHTTTGDE